VRYARMVVNAHHASQACMLPPCAHLVPIMPPHCTAQVLRAEAAAYATLARSSSFFLKRGLGRKEAAAYATLARSSTRIT
jgi:hypothetical protein